MACHGEKSIKILSEEMGKGPELKKGDRVRLRYRMQLHRGEFLGEEQVCETTMGSRELIAGFRYGLEGMRAGGTRKFRASPHLCYRDGAVPGVPKNAVLIFDIQSVEILPP